MAPQKFLRFPDSRPDTCHEAHEHGLCFGWCHLPAECFPPIPIYDVDCPRFSKEGFTPKPMEMPAGLLFYLDYKFSEPEFVGKMPVLDPHAFPCTPRNKEP